MLYLSPVSSPSLNLLDPPPSSSSIGMVVTSSDVPRPSTAKPVLGKDKEIELPGAIPSDEENDEKPKGATRLPVLIFFLLPFPLV
jgi:hypothetical protein